MLLSLFSPLLAMLTSNGGAAPLALQYCQCAIHGASFNGHLDIVRFIAERAPEQLTVADSVRCWRFAGCVLLALCRS